MTVAAGGLVILLAATSSGAMTPPEAAIRQADADWAEAAATGSVEAWMTYYAAEAAVLAPDRPIAMDRKLVRQTVAELLALPHLAISWHPVKVEVAAAGDLAYAIGVYELSYDAAAGARTTDRGKILEVWRKQADGRWKCIVDTWNSDGPGTVSPSSSTSTSPSPLSPSPLASPSPAPAAVASPAIAVAPVAGLVPAPVPVPPAQGGEYGAIPVNYEAAVRRYFGENLSDPDAARYREITPPEKATIRALSGGIFIHQATLKGWSVKAIVDARNSHGVYVGFKTYTFLFRGEKIVHTVSPLGGDELK